MPTDPATAVAATPNADAVLTSITALCEAYAKAHVARTVAEHATTIEERDHHLARAHYWDTEARTRYAAIADAVQATLARRAQVEAFLPVRTLPNGHVEIHARDQHARPVVVALTGAQAVTVGVHLTAHAAIGLDRTGTNVDRVLPPIPTQPPPATTGDSPATGRAPAPTPR
ncbi:hypothetical protein ACNTMW_12840 [Planosporangium sp. 12N6]|uniref:hypothetical protein n=1 Tax=Planosporangium spinosum TaxID=3402278 RepID=UPI003CED96AB